MKIKYNNLYFHFVFTTLNRERIITEKYITGIVTNNESKMYAIYANPEHVHFLISKAPNISEERLASVVANSSESFINDNQFVKGKFRWQQSASAFTVSKSSVPKICRYILTQSEHHKRTSFSEEYEKLLTHYQKTIDIDKN